MSAADQTRDPLRYRLYFRLMDVCLLATLIIVADMLLVALFGVSAFELPLPDLLKKALTLFLVAFAMIGPFVLFAAKFMRDDYAEQLWRRSVVVLAYGVALIPLALFVIFNTAQTVLGVDGSAEIFPAWVLAEWEIVRTIYFLGWVYVLMFVLVFQFLRWRDSR